MLIAQREREKVRSAIFNTGRVSCYLGVSLSRHRSDRCRWRPAVLVPCAARDGWSQLMTKTQYRPVHIPHHCIVTVGCIHSEGTRHGIGAAANVNSLQCRTFRRCFTTCRKPNVVVSLDLLEKKSSNALFIKSLRVFLALLYAARA